MASRLIAVTEDEVLAIGPLITTNPDNAPDLGAWARKAYQHLNSIINLPEIQDSIPVRGVAEEQLATARAVTGATE